MHKAFVSRGEKARVLFKGGFTVADHRLFPKKAPRETKASYRVLFKISGQNPGPDAWVIFSP